VCLVLNADDMRCRQYIFFTDKAHIDPSSCSQGWILREEGHCLDPENSSAKAGEDRWQAAHCSVVQLAHESR
jgi:hypothetical protein